MGSGCSLGFRQTKNPVSKHKGQQFDNQSQNPEKDKNGHYNESQKSNHQTHLTNPLSTDNYGANEEFIQQVHEFEKVNQIGRYFLESEMNRAINAKAIQKWDKFLSEGYKKYIKMKKSNQCRHIFTKQNESFLFKNKELYLTVIYYDGKEKELSQFIERGLVPQSDRWSAWKAKLNVQKYFIKGLYEGLLRKQSKYVKDIKRDIGRGLNHPFFKQEDQIHSPFKSELKQQQQQQEEEELSNKKQYIFTQKEVLNTKQSIKEYNAAVQNSPNFSKKNFDQLSQQQLDQLNTYNYAKKSVTLQKNSQINQNEEFDDDRLSRHFSVKNKKTSTIQNEMNEQIKEQFSKINLDKPDNEEVHERFQTQISNSKNPYYTAHRKLIQNNQKKNHLFDYESIQNQFKCIGQESLSKVLRAISNYFPNIGYTQGMNIVVGFLLLVNGGNEEEAFWMFVSLARSENFLFMGLYEKDLPIMNLMAYVLDDKLRSLYPRLHHQILKELEVNYQEWFTWWSLSIFLEKFPLYACLRFWDFIISQGSLFSIVSIIIALLKQFDQQIIGQDDRGMFQELLDSFMKGSVTDQIVESVLLNAKKIQMTKSYISQISIQYLNSTFCISKITEKHNIYTDYLTQLNKSSQMQQQALFILTKEIEKKVCQEIVNPLSEEGNKQGTERNDIKDNQASKHQDQNSELSERQVVQQPQIDYMSSDIDYNNRRLKNSPDKSTKLQSKLPPIKQKKKDVQLIQPDDSNEPAKNKLLAIKNSNNKSKDEQINKNLFQGSNETEEKQKSNLPLIHLQSIQSNEIFSQQQQQRQSFTNQQQQLNQKNNSLKNTKNSIHKRRSSFQDVHVMSLDQIEPIQDQNNQNQHQDLITNQKNHFNKLQNLILKTTGESTPHSKYFFNSPNKNKIPKRPLSSYQDTSKKFNSSHNLYQNKRNQVDEMNEIKNAQSILKEDQENQIFKNPKEIISSSQIDQKQQILNQQMGEKDKEMQKSLSQVGSSAKQKNFSSQNSIIQSSQNEKPSTKLPSIYLQPEKISQQLFNQGQNVLNKQEQLPEKNENVIDTNQQHEESNSQTQSHGIDNDDDFNIEQNVPQKKPLSHQTTNSIPNSSHKINKYHNVQLDSIENKTKNQQNFKTSNYSSRPSSHYSSKYEHEKRMQKQQAAAAAASMIQPNHQQNLSNFSTPSVKQRQLPSLSFQKATQAFNHIEDTTQPDNQFQANTSINQPPLLQVRDRNKQRKFRPFSNTMNQPAENNQKYYSSKQVEESQQEKNQSYEKNISKKSTIKTPQEKQQLNESEVLKNQQNEKPQSRQNLEINKENYINKPEQTSQNYETQNLNVNSSSKTQDINRLHNNEETQSQEPENKLQKNDQSFLNQLNNPSYQLEETKQNEIKFQNPNQNKDHYDQYESVEKIANNIQQDKYNQAQLYQETEQSKNSKESYQEQLDQYPISKEQYKISQEQYPISQEQYQISQEQIQINKEQYQINQQQYPIGQEQYQVRDEQYPIKQKDEYQISEEGEKIYEQYQAKQEEYQTNIEHQYQISNQHYQISKEQYQIEPLKIDLGEQKINLVQQKSENKDSEIDVNNQQNQQFQNINYDPNNNNNQQLYHKDSLNSQVKKEDIAFNSNLQNDMSAYMNEFQQHNYSGFSINLTQGGAHNFQNSIHNSNIQQNQAKIFSVNQIPSLNNSRINDDNRSQISEYGFQNQGGISDQQQKISFSNIPDQVNNEITYSADENKQRELKEKSLRVQQQSTLEHLRDSDINQISAEDKNSDQLKKTLEQADLEGKLQFQSSSFTQTKPVDTTNKQFQIQSNETAQSSPFSQPRPQFTPKTERYESSFNVIPTQSPFNSQIILSQQQVQKNYQKSNSLNQLGSVASQNVLHSVSQISQNNIANQNGKFKNLGSSQGYIPSNGYDKINNFIPNHLPYSSSNYYLQEIKEENYGERNMKQKQNKDQQQSQLQISYEEEHQTYEQSKLNNSSLSHKTQMSNKERLQNFAENQNDILDEVSSSQFNSNVSAASKPPQPSSHHRKSSFTIQSQMQQQLQKQALQQQNQQLQQQQQQEFTPQRIISSAAQKNIILTQQTNTITESNSLGQLNVIQNKQLNNEQIVNMKRASIKINKDYQTPKMHRNSIQNDQSKSYSNITSQGKPNFTPQISQNDNQEATLDKQNSKRLNPLAQSVDEKPEQLKSIHSNTDFFQNFSAQKEFFQNSSAQKNFNKQLQDESSNLSSSIVSFPIPKHLITISPSTTHLQQIDQNQEINEYNQSNQNISPLKNERKNHSENEIPFSNDNEQQNVQNIHNQMDNINQNEKNDENQNKTEQFQENQQIPNNSFNNLEEKQQKPQTQNARKQSQHKSIDNPSIDFLKYNFSASINNLNNQI
ncbi:rab-GTPase-TBC domain protein (macronuclear) [Tetrahymena thermophila SB210]|uniref:Rab-GTPase-TBC domain protein n=1 Tax=Tetrahymena thermophila (strain SB210) TaxID=312017 RepID=Q22WE9_TETTS|nr:rab-GTPase-TBC domain protein [Tetrahymena thermophila SB210]EAR89468.1 rab-GTPase-TBC domain protein [Tetrahymena thermophila SB210]|eukprot:XP_001009713.1 rab-GTPase-TBC domain protein [Tetrahymena thermophila SB210]